jgi:hypothetical protein
MNMAVDAVDGYTLDELLNEAATRPTRPKKQTKLTVVCPHSGKTGHSTKRSTKCLHHKKQSKKEQQATTEQSPEDSAQPSPSRAMQDRAEDINDHDAFPLQDDDIPGSKDDEFETFYEVGTWDSDAEEEDDAGMNQVI